MTGPSRGRAWHQARLTGTAQHLHGQSVPDDGRRHLWVLEPTGPAVVLGSTQSVDVVDADVAAAGGLAVARRRSGGGAVMVAPGDPVWIDVVVPRGDPLWDDDVARAFHPIGRAWCTALGVLGVAGLAVHDGPMVRTAWSDLVCFAGTGPGEVVAAGTKSGAGAKSGAKIVGMSQRRSRAGARFQCAVPRHWDPEQLRAVLCPSPPPGSLDGCGTGIGAISTDAVVDALVTALGR